MGQNYVNSVCITEEKERELYGTNPIFIFDPQNKSNQPVPGIHVNPIKLWPLYPTYIQEAFIKTFVEGIKDPNRRITEHQWQKLLICLRSEIITCPCGRELFISKSAPENNTFICPGCGNRNSYPMRLNLNGYPVYLFPKSKVYKCHTEKDSRDYQTLTGEVVQNKSNPSIWGIKNHSADVWLITMPDGTSKSIPNGSVAPIVLGAGIAFNQVNSKIETGGCN
jgi:hypothetical protein